MGVGVQGKAGLGVAQNAGEGLGVHPGGQGVGSEGVPQIMEPKAGQFSLVQQFFEPAVCAVGIYRPLRAEGIWEDPLGQSCCLPFLQKLGGAVRKQNRPLSRIGLGLSCLQSLRPFGRGWCGAPLRSQRRCRNPPMLGRTALPGAGRWSARYRRSRARWGRIELRTGTSPAGHA